MQAPLHEQKPCIALYGKLSLVIERESAGDLQRAVGIAGREREGFRVQFCSYSSLLQAVPVRHLLQPLLAGLLALCLYLNAVHGAFILDDWTYLVENPLIRDLRFFRHIGHLQQYVAGQGITLPKIDLIYNFSLRPVSYLTFALNYKLHGLEPIGYKAVNILFHVVATMLTYLFVQLLVRQLRQSTGEDDKPSCIPLLAALLFACHPVQTQAVSYMVQRFTSIAACCYLWSLSAFIMSRRSASQATTLLWYTLSLGGAVTGMLSKENVFTLPLMITAVEFLCFREAMRKRIMLLLPFLATMAIIPLTILSLTRQTTSLAASIQLVNFEKIPHLTYIFTEFRVLITYLRLLVLPLRQQLDYDYPLYDSLLAPPVITSLLCLTALAVAGVCSLYRGRTIKRSGLMLAGFGSLWFFVTLLVESGLVPTDDVIFEHRLYLPSVGVFIAASAIGVHVSALLADNARWRIAAVSAVTAGFIVLSLATIRRNALWGDSLSFWQDNAAKSPNKPRVLQCLGDTYLLNGKPREAIAAYEKIPQLQISPRCASVYNNLGDAYIKTGDYNRGIQMYYRAIECNPNDYSLYSNLAMKYAIRGDFGNALPLFATAVKLNRNDLLSRRSRADIFLLQARNAEAVAEYEGILQIDPDDSHAQRALQTLRH